MRLSYLNILAITAAFIATLSANDNLSNTRIISQVKHALQHYQSSSSRQASTWLLDLATPARQGLQTRTHAILNEIKYASDIDHWNKNDYWATPTEFVGTEGGDCEDYAIAKFMTMVARGVPIDELRIMHVHSVTHNVAHMVLLHQPRNSNTSFVYDNLVKEVLPVNQRTDLKPVFAFNPNGMWIGGQHNVQTKVRSTVGSRLWDDLLRRIKDEGTEGLIERF